MTPMTPAEIETITKTIEIAAKDPTWCEAIVLVINSQTSATIVQAAKSVAMSVETFIAQFGVALSEPSKILRPILQNTHLTEGQATQYLYDAQRLVNNGVPEALRAGAAGAGGAGAAATGAAVGKGAIILKGLAIVGGLLVFAVVSYYVAGYLGELVADDPIEPTWLGDPEARAAFQTEHEDTTYGRLIATKNGVNVTHEKISKPVYLYYDKYDGYHLEYTSIVKHNFEPIIVDGREVVGPDKTWGIPCSDDEYPVGGPYYTYGAVCEAMEKKLKKDGAYNIARGFFCYKNSQFLCKREVLTGMEVDPFGVPVRIEDFVRGHRP
jgi:hypothetical protein